MNNNQEQNWIFLDLDGTLVDTIPALKKVFFNFVKNLGGMGSMEDFNKLNGAPLREITHYFKKKLKLSPPRAYLESCYRNEFFKVYEKMRPRKDAKSALRKLRARGWKLALVTSAPKKIASEFLKKNKIYHFFEFIISGEDVFYGKPDSQIYKLAKLRAGNGFHIAVEDSKNGMTAARGAGCTVLNFKSGSRYFFGISSFADLARRLYIIDGTPFLVGFGVESKFSLYSRNGNKGLVISRKMRKEADSFWIGEKLKNPHLYDGRLFVPIKEKAPYNFEGTLMRFRYIYYQLRKMGYINAMRGAVTGIVGWRKKVLILRRSNSVTESRGVYEFAPSGSLESNSMSGKGRLNPRLQIIKELEEELGIKRSAVTNLNNLYMVFDIKRRLFDLHYSITLKKSANPGLGAGGEHTEIKLLTYRSLEKEVKKNPMEFEPLVKLHFNLYRKK